MATISQSEWKRYCDLLRKINDKAVEEFKSWAISNLGYTHIERQKMIDYAYAIATKYGEASAALSAQMYDTVAELSNAAVPAAVPAETATYPEVAKTVNGIIKNTNGNTNTIAAGISRLVKMAGTDTILKNAARDSGDDIGYKGYHRNKSGKNKRHKHSGAQVAWIPLGDTCPFCLMLAAKGWQKQTVWAAGDHSEHIHGNCDCTYAVRFDDSLSYDSYNPDEYVEMFKNAEGETWEEKRNYLRRKQREDPEVREKINAQKRANYAANKNRDTIHDMVDVTDEYIKTAKPNSGTFKKEENFRDVNGEEKIAEWVHHTMFGGDITLLADNNPEGECNPDYLWNNKLWDLKSPTSSKHSTLEKRIKHGIDQIAKNPGGVIIDITESQTNIGEIEKIVNEIAPRKAVKNTDFIIKDGDDFKIIRQK